MLHIISHSPIRGGILKRLGEGDAVILIADAVISLMHKGEMTDQWNKVLKSHRICALQADLEARGIKAEDIVPGIEIVDDYGFVQLTIDKSSVCSWC